MNTFPKGTRVFYWLCTRPIVYATIQSSSRMPDGTQILVSKDDYGETVTLLTAGVTLPTNFGQGTTCGVLGYIAPIFGILAMFSMLPTVNAQQTQSPFPDIPFSVFSEFIASNFSSKISLSTVLLVLFTMTNNTTLLSLHARQQISKYPGERKTHTTGWITGLIRALTDQLGNKKDRLFKKSENKGGMNEDQVFVALGNKLDLFAKMLQLHPIDKDGKFKGKMKPISHDELKPVIMICPDAVECETMTCNPRSLLQNVRPRDIPEVTLIKGTDIYKKSYVLTGLCPKCQTQYSADRERVVGQTGSFDQVYLNSAVYLKVGQNVWVDCIFSSAVLNAMYNFHASANAYTDFWNNTFGELCKGKLIKISRRQVWQAFVQESIRTIADVSDQTLILKDGLSIDEVTSEAFSKLGANGIILPAGQHSCSECTQKYKKKADFLTGDDPAALVGRDENRVVPSLTGEGAADAAQDAARARELASRVQEDSDDEPMDVDHAPVKMDQLIVHMVIAHQHLAMLEEVSFVLCMKLNMEQSVIVQIQRSPSRFYCVETITAPCGVVIAWAKFPKSESPTNILNFLESVYPTAESRPDYICIDKACLLLRTAISNGSWDRIWKHTTQFIVDSYHYINHRVGDYICRKWCNPAPLNGSAPNLVVVEKDKHGRPYYKRAFNTQACEQLNAWLGGFESILKRMTQGNFDWFLSIASKTISVASKWATISLSHTVYAFRKLVQLAAFQS
ncbi:uncharacterized protein LACBIDRAFT_331942 [Laccaria bicolor S238N-H82]|uniref:Predicted protein n=1 Tax=Laccaria bicolor (strain S238N-H82 / ATCC MYA-4686) TaxID=486041 RepID=B0DR41_LACBS|nr:uncharacterized protein LACBIDRAFT_331942 [Laccaria bicolor S238N-H82]EDR02933.1 predicted protein [Laccaria bicolor S238N-H82]|eukprot:XP_001886356.1 predicted protein [Laccaria bicolor S238N-H82]